VSGPDDEVRLAACWQGDESGESHLESAPTGPRRETVMSVTYVEVGYGGCGKHSNLVRPMDEVTSEHKPTSQRRFEEDRTLRARKQRLSFLSCLPPPLPFGG